MNHAPPKDWLEICLQACKGNEDEAQKLVRRLWDRHGLPGATIEVRDGVVIVGHPGGIVGLETGWERLG